MIELNIIDSSFLGYRGRSQNCILNLIEVKFEYHIDLFNPFKIVDIFNLSQFWS